MASWSAHGFDADINIIIIIVYLMGDIWNEYVYYTQSIGGD